MLGIPLRQIIIALMWASFISAGVTCGLIFAWIDPNLLLEQLGLDQQSRLQGYSLAFFFFWQRRDVELVDSAVRRDEEGSFGVFLDIAHLMAAQAVSPGVVGNPPAIVAVGAVSVASEPVVTVPVLVNAPDARVEFGDDPGIKKKSVDKADAAALRERLEHLKARLEERLGTLEEEARKLPPEEEIA